MRLKHCTHHEEIGHATEQDDECLVGPFSKRGLTECEACYRWQQCVHQGNEG